MKIKILAVLSSLIVLSALPVPVKGDSYNSIYRKRVFEYNKELRSAEENIAATAAMSEAARADYFPKFSGNAYFSYTGFPMELDLAVPSLANGQLHIKGRNIDYGFGLSLQQPLYAGGYIREQHRRSKLMSEIASDSKDMKMSEVSYQADLRYWTEVANKELVSIAESFRESVGNLVKVVRERVEAEYADRNDLLMAEVKYNDAEYNVMQARNNYEVARMSMNIFAGVEVDTVLETDSAVIAITDNVFCKDDLEGIVAGHPELRKALHDVDRTVSEGKIADASFLPYLSLGVDGLYSSPGYNFKPDMNPNYAVYAKLNVPIFEWGKRKHVKMASEHNVNMAEYRREQIEDEVLLNLKSAYFAFEQAVGQVLLTGNSLEKARENEEVAMARYIEGESSIIEVLDAQIYCQQARLNYVRSKFEAQVSRAELIYSAGRYIK